jgi:hypothetical protein
MSLRAVLFCLIISLGLEEPKSLSCRRFTSFCESRVCSVSTIRPLAGVSEFLLGLPPRCVFPVSVCLSLNIRLNIPLVGTVALFSSGKLLVCGGSSDSTSFLVPGRIDLVLSGTEIVLSLSDFFPKLIFSRIVWLEDRSWLASREEGFLFEIKFPIRDLILGREFDCSVWVVTGGSTLGVDLIGSDEFLIMVGRLFEELVIEFGLTREVTSGGDIVVELGLVVFVLTSELPRGLPRRRRVKLSVVVPLDVDPPEIVARCLVNVCERTGLDILEVLSPIEGLLNRWIEVLLVRDFVVLVRGWGLLAEDDLLSC